MGPCNLEIQEIHAILVKSTDFMAIWLNKFCLENFVFFTENGHYWLWALPWKFGGKIKF